MKTFNDMISYKKLKVKMKILAAFALLISSLFPYYISGLVTDLRDGSYPGFSVYLSNGVTNYKRVTDANGFFQFDSITNGAWGLNVVVPNYMKMSVSNYTFTVANADVSTNFRVTLANTSTTNLDFVIPPYFLGNRSDSLSVQVLKENTASERVVLVMTKLNGRERFVVFDGYVSGKSGTVVIYSESIRNKLTIGAYVMELILVKSGDPVPSAENPVRRRTFIYSE